MDIIKYVNEELLVDNKFPDFKPGDNINVSEKIVEGSKSRTQHFKGNVISIKGEGLNKSFTIRKLSNGVGVEKIFPFSNPNIEEITILKRGKVRRAKLYYLRGLVGKKAKIKEATHKR